jgi:hypothetical protein
VASITATAAADVLSRSALLQIKAHAEKVAPHLLDVSQETYMKWVNDGVDRANHLAAFQEYMTFCQLADSIGRILSYQTAEEGKS